MNEELAALQRIAAALEQLLALAQAAEKRAATPQAQQFKGK